MARPSPVALPRGRIGQPIRDQLHHLAFLRLQMIRHQTQAFIAPSGGRAWQGGKGGKGHRLFGRGRGAQPGQKAQPIFIRARAQFDQIAKLGNGDEKL